MNGGTWTTYFEASATSGKLGMSKPTFYAISKMYWAMVCRMAGEYEDLILIAMEREGLRKCIDWLSDHGLMGQFVCFVSDRDCKAIAMFAEDPRLKTVLLRHDPGCTNSGIIFQWNRIGISDLIILNPFFVVNSRLLWNQMSVSWKNLSLQWERAITRYTCSCLGPFFFDQQLLEHERTIHCLPVDIIVHIFKFISGRN